ncbi:hypothetical protein DL766_009820 [Monosporascus sp. MC13-8B]|uniref:Uncharacterized protein n=1 Tax=Monosporascus cannonballus TaxID=155416 RepID=A0ABY0H5M6_9PEZI|nr:hypothetical protein DL762_005593 [Monosporascus cannonballus]RYP00153.1 hypothetical protein DL763_001082 [Monosporascus cannonballus]RYP13696.1 hypothetical protein DL766_009820 [Monosporascus sp. MC13-8B]
MFDVLWTDPNRELLKDKISKREQEGRNKGKVTKRSQNNRRSLSTHSSSSSDRGLGLFTKARKTLTIPSKPKNPTTSPDLSTEEVPRARRTSAHGVKSLLSHPDGSEVTVKPVTGSLLPVQPHDFSDAASGASSRDSVLSRGAAHQSAVATGTWADEITEGDSPVTTKSEYLFQSLGPSSFITKATEVTVSPRVPDTDLDQLISEINISAGVTKSATPPTLGSGDGSASRDSAVYHSTDSLVRTPMTIEGTEFLMPPSHFPQTPSSTKTRNNHIAHLPDWNVDDSAANSDAWKPPHEWGCTPTKRARSASPEDRQQISSASLEIDHYMSPGIVTLQREVRMMEMASPEIILANMEAGMDVASDHASDTMIYQQHEMEKKRWVFWALHYIGGYAEFETLHRYSYHASSSRAPRILALYETPDWLEIGRLRGEGSTITTLSAPVVGKRITSPGKAKDASTVKAELRFEAVKKLWQEVWGRFVRADRWWWDEEDIMQECKEYGTTWEYSHIVAAKGD